MSVEQTVARWKAGEASVRARLAATAGYARPEEVQGLTGMQIFEAIFAGTLPRPPIFDRRTGAGADSSRRADSASPSAQIAHI